MHSVREGIDSFILPVLSDGRDHVNLLYHQQHAIYHGDRDVDAAAKPSTCVDELMTQLSLTPGSIFIYGFTKAV